MFVTTLGVSIKGDVEKLQNIPEAHPEPNTQNPLADTQQALERIVFPELSMEGVPLAEALKLLAQNALAYDPQGKGVNIVAIDPEHQAPHVSLHVQNLSLYEILSLIAESAKFRLFTEPHVAVLRPSIESQRYQTQTFALSRAALIELTGLHAELRDGASPTRVDEEQAILGFLGRAGISFEEGTRLAYDGTQLYLTHSTEALGKAAHILKNFQKPKQVQIEIKFLEVGENALKELGLNWFIKNNGDYVQTADPRYVANPQSPSHLRSLNQASSMQGSQLQSGLIVSDNTPATGIPVPTQAPAIPGASALASQVFSNASLGGLWQGLNIRAVVRALEQRNDSELLHAPNITVLSGKTAEIKIVRKLYYPESYGEMRSSASPGSHGKKGSTASAIAIVAARPEKFTFEEIGVKVSVTPRVEADGSIHLELTPTVTNLKDWILYGGSSFMLSGRTTVEVPSGFYQPLFESRTMRTEVRLHSGHTILMGGLTHETVFKVEDGVPFLSKFPIIGNLFKSKGESMQKTTLLIAATAWVVPSGQDIPLSPPSLELLQTPVTLEGPPTPKSRRSRKRQKEDPRLQPRSSQGQRPSSASRAAVLDL